MDPQRLSLALSAPLSSLGVLDSLSTIRPQFYPHLAGCVPSTNKLLWELLEQGAPAGTVVIAAEQSAGKAQWGRTWTSLPGGLYLSLALKPNFPASESALTTLAAAWGVAASLNNLSVPVGIKWPNDLVIHGQKLGGILTETRLESNQIQTLVIGIGLNWSNPTPPTGINLHRFFPGLPPAPLNSLENLAAVVLYGLLQGYFYWREQGVAALLTAHQSLFVNLGQEVSVNGFKGEIVGIAASGNLQVQCRGKTETLEVEPGEISLGYNA